MYNIMTVIGIRPDFIRMSKILSELDKNFNHIMVHTGQHFDYLLSEVFFKELGIRKPDYNLEIGKKGKQHYYQLADVSIALIELIKNQKLSPDLILFLGDSNSVGAAFSLKKEGYVIGHIEAGMRSHDRRMLEEINRIVCDHCSDYHFVYHQDYKTNLIDENLAAKNIFVVGNTIVEACRPFVKRILKEVKKKDHIIMDIHRPENFQYKQRMENIIKYANISSEYFQIPVKMLGFKRTLAYLEEYKIDLGNVQVVDLMSYEDFLQAQYDALFVYSDSGTAQEESALLDTPAIVPRDYTERPQSVSSKCSYMINVNHIDTSWNDSWTFIEQKAPMDKRWLGEGKTSQQIIEVLKHL